MSVVNLDCGCPDDVPAIHVYATLGRHLDRE